MPMHIYEPLIEALGGLRKMWGKEVGLIGVFHERVEKLKSM